MGDIIRATWFDLEKVIGSASENLIICTPYYSTEGIERIFDYWVSNSNLVFITRLSPSDWLRDISDPESLATFIEIFSEEGIEINLIIHQRLHAKAYIADESSGLIGSANLSAGGFVKNFELMVQLEIIEAKKACELIKDEANTNGRAIEVSSLRNWVNNYSCLIKSLKKIDDESKDLAEMQRDLDNLLGYGSETQKMEQHLIPEMGKFVEWLIKNRNLPGAEVLIDRHLNISGQNLTGHFKQSYYGVANFLLLHNDYIEKLSLQLDSLDSNRMFQPEEDLLDAWVKYLDLYATKDGDEYDYAILRGILPPNLGGTLLGGGGGSSTIKRMFPIVARFIYANGG